MFPTIVALRPLKGTDLAACEGDFDAGFGVGFDMVIEELADGCGGEAGTDVGVVIVSSIGDVAAEASLVFWESSRTLRRIVESPVGTVEFG